MRATRKWLGLLSRKGVRSKRRKISHLKLRYLFVTKMIKTVIKTNSKEGCLMIVITIDNYFV
jgi:hypothetical protein